MKIDKFLHCDHDGDCQIGQFCLHKKGQSICHNCQDCTNTFYRESRGSCAKNGLECGSCLPGYSELRQSQNEFSQRCVRNGNFQPPSSPTLEIRYVYITVGSVIGILALFGLYFLWKKKKGKSSSKVGPINPPQEDQVQSQKTTEETPLRSTSSNSGQISRQISLENETKLQAIPFCGPNYPAYDVIPTAPPASEPENNFRLIRPRLSNQEDDLNNNLAVSRSTISTVSTAPAEDPIDPDEPESSDDSQSSRKRSHKTELEVNVALLKIKQTEEFLTEN